MEQNCRDLNQLNLNLFLDLGKPESPKCRTKRLLWTGQNHKDSEKETAASVKKRKQVGFSTKKDFTSESFRKAKSSENSETLKTWETLISQKTLNTRNNSSPRSEQSSNCKSWNLIWEIVGLRPHVSLCIHVFWA